jgi:hypothetical protein
MEAAATILLAMHLAMPLVDTEVIYPVDFARTCPLLVSTLD